MTSSEEEQPGSEEEQAVPAKDAPEPCPEEVGEQDGESSEALPQSSSRQRVLFVLAAVLLAPVALLAGAFGASRFLAPPPDAGHAYVLHVALPPAGGTLGLPPVQGPLDASRPLVVIDPGHGGHDPGAPGVDEKGHPLREKDITLALALALRDKLLAAGGVRVALTRETDRYLMLEERSGIARQLKADLFVSIHADSSEAADASGATLYTLSDRGSSQEASRIAARENRADTVDGVPLAGTSNAVSAILVDLSQRHAGAQSTRFAELALREGKDRFDFRARPLQSAAFVVLKAPDVPSVLFEAGYISNGKDSARLASPEGREAFAAATAQAIRVYFARENGVAAAQ
ncbi:N-acetylmuramoyl-L-alanine amidase [Novosphingobium sp.]|uniref:N-acetylmuramoyl-L-alanine amidase family protein n=1 Tax=Novosphingobium sp. TaxID=1874826 RepID=UPI0031E3615D